jgi:hypothetical protein
MPNNEEDNDKLLDAYGKMSKKLCGKPYTVKRGGKTFTKYCSKKKGHWGKHG